MKTSVALYFCSRCLFAGACLVVAFSALGESRDFLTLLPDNPSGQVGEDMRLSCTLTNKSLRWQDLIFTMAYYSKLKHHRIPATDVRNLSDWSAEVTLHNLTDDHHLAIIFCRYPDQDVDSQIITVGRPPAIPKIYYYRYLDWKEFVFRWKITPPTNGFQTNYMAWFKSSGQLDFTPCQGVKCHMDEKPNCPYQVENSCHVTERFLKPSMYDGYLHFKVNATNIAGSETSDIVSVIYYEYTEPGPVTELKVLSTYKTAFNGYVDVLHFFPPKEQESFVYEILLVSTENSADRRQILWNDPYKPTRKMRSRVLKGLNPFTVYNLSIRSRVKLAVADIWSEWSNVTFRSHEEVPSTAPNVCQCCFEVDEDSVERTALVYFKPLTKAESRGKVSYDVKYKATTVKRSAISSYEDNQRNLNGSGVDSETDFNKTSPIVNESTIERTKKVPWDEMGAAFVRLNLSKSVQYQLILYAKTKAGLSRQNPTTVFIPTQSELLQPPANCSVMSVDGTDEKRVVFRWNSTTSVGGHDLKKVTVFWCKAFLNSMRCRQPLNWRELPSDVASVDVNLTDSFEEYLFGIGQVLENEHNSGIHWTCSYFKKNAVASPPHLIPLEIDETQVVIKLDKPNYNPKEGLVYGFNLYYSEVDDEGRQKSKKYIEDWDTRGIVAIEGLKRGTSYKFKAETLTTAGPSYTNASVIIVTRPFRLVGHRLVWTIFAAVVIGIFAVVGFSCCIRWPHEKLIKFRKWIKEFEPCMPTAVLDKSKEQRNDSSYPTYYVLSESTARDNALNQMAEQLEEDQGPPDRTPTHSEDAVQAYSRIAARPEDSRRDRRLSQEMDKLKIGLNHTDTTSIHQHVLPLLERATNIPTHDQLLPLLPNLEATSEQSDPSVNDSNVSSDVGQTSSSNSYLPLKTVEDGILWVASHEHITTDRQHMRDNALPTARQHINSDIANRVIPKYHTTTSQPAKENFTNNILPSPNELDSLETTCQILPTTSRHVRFERNHLLPELSQNVNESMADRILPISSQPLNANVMDTDRSRSIRTGEVLRPTDRSTFDRSEFETAAVDMLSDQTTASNNANTGTPSLQRILPRLLEPGRDPNTQTESDNFTKPPNKPIQTKQKDDGLSTSGAVRGPDEPPISGIAEVHGRYGQSQHLVRANCSSCASSSSTEEISSRTDDSILVRRAQPFAVNDLEDDEGIYL